MQFKLVEILNTRYLYLPYKIDIAYIFNTVKNLRIDPNYKHNVGSDLLGQVYSAAKVGTPIEFDLAGAKLTPDIVDTLSIYVSEGFVLIDTADPVRNNILKVNRERINLDTSQFVELPRYDINTLPSEYIKALTVDVVYKLPITDPEIYVPLVYMIICTRPKVKINFNVHNHAFFNFVGSRLTLDILEKYDEFYYTTSAGTVVIKFQNGKAGIQKHGEVSIEDAMTTGTLVPTVLGTTTLHRAEGWGSIFKECMDYLNNYRGTRKQTLDELF